MPGERAARTVFRSVGWVVWHAVFCILMGGVGAGFALDVAEPLAAASGAAGLALAVRALSMSVVVSDDMVRVRNLFRTHTIPTQTVRDVEMGPTNAWFSLSRDQLIISGNGQHAGASSCCQSWWWKVPSIRLRDAVRADMERRTGRELLRTRDVR